jgi:hypothetical protein
MKKTSCLLLAALTACGGEATAPFTGLSGAYNAVVLPGDQPWIVSWPSTSTQSGCAQINSSKLTFNSASAVTEDRGYVPLQSPFVVTITSYTGTYSLIGGSNQIELKIDGGVDTATLGTYLGNPAFVAHRRFPDYTSCGSTGPYTMVYSK